MVVGGVLLHCCCEVTCGSLVSATWLPSLGRARQSCSDAMAGAQWPSADAMGDVMRWTDGRTASELADCRSRRLVEGWSSMNGSVWLVQLSNVGVTDVGGKAEKGSASGGEPRGCRLGPRHLLDPSPLLLLLPPEPL